MAQSCPPGFKWVESAQLCVPEDEMGGGGSGPGAPPSPGSTPAEAPQPPQQGGGGPGNCPPGQVYRTDSQGSYGSGKPGCEPEDWRSKQDRDTCLGARPNCGAGYDAWCDFTTAEWKCGWIGGKVDPNEGDIRKDPKAGLQYNLRQGHATMVAGRSDLAGNVGKGNPADSSTWSECWQVPSGKLVPCPKGLTLGSEQVSVPGGGGGGFGYQGGGFPATPYEMALAAQLGSLSDEFGKFASNVFGVSFPAYKQGVDYYSTLLGKGGRGKMQAAVAPAAEQVAAGTEGTLRALGSGYLGGGAREQAEIAARLQGQGEVAGLTQGIQPAAANALIEAGGAGMAQGQSATGNAAQILSGLANLSTSSRLSGEGMDLQRELGFAGLELEGQKLDLTRDLGFAGLDLSYAQLAESSNQFRAQLAQQWDMFNTGLDWEKFQFGENQKTATADRMRESMRYQQGRRDNKRALKMQMLGGAGQSAGQLGAAALSAAKFKEDIRPAVPHVEALRRIAEEAAPALRGWRYRSDQVGDAALRLSGVEFDNALILDLAPRYGIHPTEDAPGGQYVNFLALLGDLVGAVRALRDENRGLRERVEAAERAAEGRNDGPR